MYTELKLLNSPSFNSFAIFFDGLTFAELKHFKIENDSPGFCKEEGSVRYYVSDPFTAHRHLSDVASRF